MKVGLPAVRSKLFSIEEQRASKGVSMFPSLIIDSTECSTEAVAFRASCSLSCMRRESSTLLRSCSCGVIAWEEDESEHAARRPTTHRLERVTTISSHLANLCRSRQFSQSSRHLGLHTVSPHGAPSPGRGRHVPTSIGSSISCPHAP